MIFELFCSEMGYIFKGTATQKCALHNKDISTSSDKSTGGYHTKAETGNGELIWRGKDAIDCIEGTFKTETVYRF